MISATRRCGGDDDVVLRLTGLRLSRVRGEGEEEAQQPLGHRGGAARVEVLVAAALRGEGWRPRV